MKKKQFERLIRQVDILSGCVIEVRRAVDRQTDWLQRSAELSDERYAKDQEQYAKDMEQWSKESSNDKVIDTVFVCHNQQEAYLSALANSIEELRQILKQPEWDRKGMADKILAGLRANGL
jgi:ribosome recycling factor